MNGSLLARNIVAIPPDSVREKINHISQQVAEQYDSEFVLSESSIAHVSWYQTSYSANDEEVLITRTRQIAASTKPFTVTLNSFAPLIDNPKSDWYRMIFWDARRSSRLSSLHNQLLANLAPLRARQLLPIHEQLLKDKTIPLSLRRSLGKNGTLLAGDVQRPHVTLTCLKEGAFVPTAMATLKDLHPEPLEFEVNHLYITDVGPLGTCQNVLRQFSLHR